MYSLVRFCFVAFLVLLQLVIPLIHAHINDQNISGISFHLPEFEQVNLLLEKKPIMTSLLIHEGQTVTVSAGMKKIQKRFLYEQDTNHAVVLCILFIVIFSLRAIKCFSIHTEPIKVFYFFNLTAPRAPPVVLNF